MRQGLVRLIPIPRTACLVTPFLAQVTRPSRHYSSTYYTPPPAHAAPRLRHGKLTCIMSDTMPSTPTSEASTKVDNDSSVFHDDDKGLQRRASRRTNLKETATSRDILLFLVAFRILNALSIRTFFQPDEYFQSLEPAWQIAFGEDSGAWITWV